MEKLQSCTIIGGGLAGLTAAVHLAKAGHEVVVIEKKNYPQHKVCGEYVSNEVLPYFDFLNFPIRAIQPKQVTRFRLYAPSGKWVETPLPLGGFGMRRYTLDQALFSYAQSMGVRFLLETNVTKVAFAESHFKISGTKNLNLRSDIVIGSYGKRSNLDKKLARPFLRHKSTYLGGKFYVSGDFPGDLVTLYNFAGGYCGAVQVEDGSIDVAYLTHHNQVKTAGSIEAFEKQVLAQNPAIGELFNGKKITQTLTISNVSFAPKKPVVDHMLMIGDAAGMIPPLCGNGMAMGIHAAKKAAELVDLFLRQKIDRKGMETQYEQKWNALFRNRLLWGRKLHRFMGHPVVSELAVGTLKLVPGLLPPIIRQTHGAPF